MEYMNAAASIEPRGIYYYFMAYIKFDYFKRKFMNVPPPYTDYMDMAYDAGLSEADANELFAMLGVEQPAEIAV
jgi:hypothetical protein